MNKFVNARDTGAKSPVKSQPVGAVDPTWKREAFEALKEANGNGRLVIGKRPTFTKAQRRRCWEDYGGECNGCNRSVGSRFEVDHIVRWSWGGKHEPANWQLLCIPCHAEKTGEEAPQHAKARRNERREVEGPQPGQIAAHVNPWPPTRKMQSRPFPGGRKERA